MTTGAQNEGVRSPVAERSQVGGSVSGVAPTVAELYRALCDEGLSEKQALYVVGEYVKGLVQTAFQNPTGSEGGSKA